MGFDWHSPRDQRTWSERGRSVGVPKEWQELQLMEVLEKAGMLAPEMLKRFYKKDSSNWVARASVENKDFIEIQAGEHLIFVTPGPGAWSRNDHEESGSDRHDVQ